MTSQHQQLAELLAETDAVFFPLRRQGDDPSQAQLAKRFEFREKGLPYRNPGSAKGRMLLLAELERAGFVVASRGQGRASHWRLTDHGDETTRALVGMTGRAACMAILNRMAALADAGDYLPTTHDDGLRFIRETDLGQFDYGGGEKYFRAVQRQGETLAFGWPRGWLTSGLLGGFGSRNAPMAHALTDAGMAALTMSPVTIKLPKRDADLADYYCKKFVEFGEALALARHKEPMAIYLQRYFLDWDTANSQRKKISHRNVAAGKTES